MKLIKTFALLAAMLVTFVGMGNAIASPAVTVSASAPVHQALSAQEAGKPMKEEYLYRETGDTFAFRFAVIGVIVALIFTVMSFASGGRRKSRG